MPETPFASRSLRAAARLVADFGWHGGSAALLHYEWNHGERSSELARLVGNARLHAGDNANALVFFREAVRRDVNDAEARAGLVCALFRNGDVREASREAAALAEIAPCAEMWVLVAELRKRVGDTIGSLEAFRAAARAEGAVDRFVLGEVLLGDAAWRDLSSSLAGVRKGRQAAGVGTHLVRSRSSLVARAWRARKAAAVVVLSLGVASAARAQAAAPTPVAEASPSPTPQYRPEVSLSLPAASSFTGRAVRLNAGLVLEREEGAGLFPTEPSRFAFRGGSWTQSRIVIDGFDVTDPVFGGRPVAWGATELAEVEVVTDARGTALVQNHMFATDPRDGTHFVAQGNFGLFDSSGTTADPIPSLARGHSLFDGLFAVNGVSASKATQWSAAMSGSDVQRSERDSDWKKGTARLGFEGHLRQTRGRDVIQALGLYQSRRGPYGFTSTETRAKGLLFGTAWSRAASSAEKDGPRARASFRRGTVNDPGFPNPVLFERLVDGTPAQQVPYDTTGGVLALEGGMGLSSPNDRLRLAVTADLSRSTAGRALAQPTFEALERLNGLSARRWLFTSVGESRLAELRARVALDFKMKLSDSMRLSGAVALQRLSIGDRDGDSILGSTKILPTVRFDWKMSDDATFFAEGSLDTPPSPLAGYEAATKNAPTVSARLWKDANRDGQAVAAELGAEVARRSAGSVTADPDLRLPNMRRVIVGFSTKLGPVGMHAVAFARRDRDLIETSLTPQSSEIAKLRNVADPSGDIVGPSDDQVLGIAEEAAASFTSSRYLLTNPLYHRALGEGAELGFEANSERVFWGLNGAAFRDSGRGGNRGLRVTENDFGVVGESFDRTNTDTYGYGRLFFDRAYSLKMYLTAVNIHGFTLGALGRYDDGQPFARLVIQNDLPQGPDFVQAIARGRARLHYTLSVDARVARTFEISGSSVEFSASVFNALGSKFEAEEQVVWLPDYRRITMVQPPRSFVFGVRIAR